MSALEYLDRERMQHFIALDITQQADAVRRLSLAGHSKQTIARATGLSAEAVQSILAAMEKS